MGAIEFGSPWVARKFDAYASSTHLASDANGVSLHTLGVSQQATRVSKPATSVLVTGDATPEADEWKWVNIDDDWIFFWVSEKDKTRPLSSSFQNYLHPKLSSFWSGISERSQNTVLFNVYTSSYKRHHTVQFGVSDRHSISQSVN